MVIPKINSAHGSDTRNIINAAIEALNKQGVSIQNLVANGQLTPTQFSSLIQSVNSLVKSGEINVDDLSIELKKEIEKIYNKADISYVDERVQAANVPWKMAFDTLGELQTNFPDGDSYNHVVLSDGYIYAYHSGGWKNTGVTANPENIADRSVTKSKLGGHLIDEINEIPTLRGGLYGVDNLLLEQGYTKEESYKPALKTGTYISDKAILSTFSGWAAPLFYSGQSFKKVRLYLVKDPAVSTSSIKVSILDKDLNYLESTTGIINKTGWSEFEFSRIISSDIIEDDAFYIAAEVEGNASRLTTADIDLSSDFAGSPTLKGYYTTTAVPAGNWYPATHESGYTTVLLAELISTESVVKYIKGEGYGDAIVLPNRIDAVVGKEVNIYFDNVISGYQEDYFINVNCSIGSHQKNRWTVVPTVAGEDELTLELYDKNYQLIDTKSTTVVTKSASVGNGIKRSVIFVGSSSTYAGIYTEELLNIFSGDPMNIELLGTQGVSPNVHEGRGGWTFQRYYNTTESPFVYNGVFDFKEYITSNLINVPDYVVFQLGINDVFGYTSDDSVIAPITTAVNSMESMIQNIRTEYPGIKIGVALNYPAADQNAFGIDYKNGQTAWRYKRNWFLLKKKMIEKLEGRQSEGIYVIPVGTNVDTRNNMQTGNRKVNSRNEKIETVQSNGVHLADSGYHQMADSMYYWLKGMEG